MIAKTLVYGAILSLTGQLLPYMTRSGPNICQTSSNSSA